MKTVLLAGGYGSRIGEETHLRPKPMIEIGGKPILWHIMKSFSCYDFNEFTICLGYKGYVIKEYFANYALHESDVTFNFKDHSAPQIHAHSKEPWVVTLVNTGTDTMTGGRLGKVKDYVGNKTFFMTYGDGLSNINLKELLKFHKSHGKLATVTGVQPYGRFGLLEVGDDNVATSFEEKAKMSDSWVNGGFFVLEPGIFDYITNPLDDCVFEQDPLKNLAAQGQLLVYKHDDFWSPMDTLRDKKYLERLWAENRAPWKLW